MTKKEIILSLTALFQLVKNKDCILLYSEEKGQYIEYRYVKSEYDKDGSVFHIYENMRDYLHYSDKGILYDAISKIMKQDYIVLNKSQKNAFAIFQTIKMLKNGTIYSLMGEEESN